MALPMCSAWIALSCKGWTYPSTICDIVISCLDALYGLSLCPFGMCFILDISGWVSKFKESESGSFILALCRIVNMNRAFLAILLYMFSPERSSRICTEEWRGKLCSYLQSYKYHPNKLQNGHRTQS